MNESTIKESATVVPFMYKNRRNIELVPIGYECVVESVFCDEIPDVYE
jgi:hypothetical protein